MLVLQKPILLVYLMLQFLVSYSQKNENKLDSISSRKQEIALNNKGFNLINEGLYIQALDTFNASLRLRIKNHGEIHNFLSASYNGIGIAYRNLGQYDLALKNFRLAELNYHSNKEKFSNNAKRILYSNIGNVYRSKLDYNMALLYFNQSLSYIEISDESLIEQKAKMANINSKIAEIYYSINEYEKALNLINSNIEYADIEDQIYYYELLAFIYQVKEDYVQARKKYQNAINLTIYNNEDDDISIAWQYLNYSLFLTEIDEYSEAKDNLEKAYDIIKRVQPEKGLVLANYFSLRGYYSRYIPIEEKNLESFAHQKKKNLLESVEWYSRALKALNFPSNYTIEDIQNSNEWLSIVDCIDFLEKIADTNYEIASLFQVKNSEQYIYYLTVAIDNYKIASTLIQKARKEISNDDSKITLTELEQSTFHELVKTAYSAYSFTKNPQYIETAFQSAERTKASTVFDKLSVESAMDNSLIPDSLIQRENKLNNTISFYSEQLFEEENRPIPDALKVNEYESSKLKAIQQRDSLNLFLETKYPDYYQLKYSESLITTYEIQKKLNDDEVILEYVLREDDVDSELYTFVISNDTVEFHNQKINQDIMNDLESMFYFMSNSNYIYTTNEESKEFCLSSNNMYKVLIAPFYDSLVDKKLIIVPDGKINYIAFDALIKDLPETFKQIRFNQLDYLIKEFNISYSYSANLLFKLKHSDKKLRNRIAAFAPEYQGDTIEIAGKSFVLVPLPGVQKEVEEIATTVNTQIFKGTDATETNFRKNQEEYDILHLAMHAIINDSLPSFSQLSFSPDSSENLNTMGSLSTLDIYNLNINACLTVLSACNTGGGVLKKGEGIISLARGFFYAGCPSVIMSLWEVEDESGAQIMSSFYKNLKKGKAKDEALRLAKLEYIEKSNSRRSHPHYWSGYINLGNNSPLYKSYDFYFFLILLVLVTGVFTDQVYRIKKARKKRAF